MKRKTVALSVNAELYERYKQYCEENSIILSRKFDEFMKKELQKAEKQ
jgi:phage/plasmid-associated DNA primase